jgi:plastocyanin domain-containing protein
LTTLSNPTLGASNAAQITSPINFQTSNIHKAHQASKKIVELEMQRQKVDGKKPQSIQVD